MFKNSQKGVSIFLAMLFMGMILSIILGVSVLLIGQMKIISGLEDSVIAFYAADTGIEDALESTIPSVECATEEDTCYLDNEAEYYVEITVGGVIECPAPLSYCIKSIGIYKGTRRSVEVTY